MSAYARAAWGVLRRDLVTVGPWAWPIGWLDAGLSVTLWFFVTRVAGVVRPLGVGLPTDYFTFSLIGLALSQYAWHGFSAFNSRIKGDLASGVLEALWLARYPLPFLIALSGLTNMLTGTVNAGLILIIGTYGFGAQLRGLAIVSILGIGMLTAVAMGALGLLSASWAIAWGRGEVLQPLLNKVVPILSGAFFPITLFPSWAQALARCVPLTHALALARGLTTREPSGIMVEQEVASLLVLTILLVAVGLGSLHLAIDHARLSGRLATG